MLLKTTRYFSNASKYSIPLLEEYLNSLGMASKYIRSQAPLPTVAIPHRPEGFCIQDEDGESIQYS